MNLKSWLNHQLKKRNQIYIMPTRMGGYLNGLIFLLFLLSLGYSNNLLLIFTLFLFGLNLIWVIQSHFYMKTLKLSSVVVQDHFAKEKTQALIFWEQTPTRPYLWNLSLLSSHDEFILEAISSNEKFSDGQVKFSTRGVRPLTHLKVQTEMPFGLYSTWIYYPISLLVYVYPARLQEVPELLSLKKHEEGDFSSLRTGPHDVWNLAPYQGEESRKISWKHYARSGELVVKEGEELTKAQIHFRLTDLSDNKEHVLSQMATQMFNCSKLDQTFTLETIDKKIHTGLHECLRELAKC